MTVYIKTLEKMLLPFVESLYPDSHRLMADNDPKNMSNAAKDFLAGKKITWWCTPAESLDCNLIENLWHELKEYIRSVTKPRN